YPDIQIDLGVTDRPVDLVGENVDCVVRGGELSDQSLIARRIAELPFVTCAAPSYLERYGEPDDPTAIESNHYVVSYMHPRSGRSMSFEFARGSERTMVRGRYVVSVNDSMAYVAAAIAGLGIIQAPTFMVYEHFAAGTLKQILPSWTIDRLPLHVVYAPNKHLSNRLRVFVDWVADLFARHDRLRGHAVRLR
ncbi:MAG: LysR substrate-binding domain-containing protein, partial [bacterium]